MKSLTTIATVTLAFVAALGGVALAQDDGKSCTPKTLRGTYVFAAHGYNIVAGVPQPKAILEMMQLHGDGSLTVDTATVSINGTITQSPAGGAGEYSLDENCVGTLTFTPGPSFNIVADTHGDTFWMIQTNTDTVLQGTVTRVSH